MIRAFAAIQFPDAVKEKIDQELSPLRESLEEGLIRWVNPDLYHLTLKFFGDVSEDQIPEIKSRLSDAASRSEAFSLSVGKFGAFPTIQKPRVLWVGLSDPTTHLETLHSTLETGLASLGFKAEKRQFHAHITIGRVHRRTKKDEITRMRAPLMSFTLGPIVDVQVKEIALIRSELTPAGPVYTLLNEFPLGDPDS